MKKLRARFLVFMTLGLLTISALTINFMVRATTVPDDTFAAAKSANQDLPNRRSFAARAVYTKSFGYFEFGTVPSGATYIVTVGGRKYAFENPPQVVSVSDHLRRAEFYGE